MHGATLKHRRTSWFYRTMSPDMSEWINLWDLPVGSLVERYIGLNPESVEPEYELLLLVKRGIFISPRDMRVFKLFSVKDHIPSAYVCYETEYWEFKFMPRSDYPCFQYDIETNKLSFSKMWRIIKFGPG